MLKSNRKFGIEFEVFNECLEECVKFHNLPNSQLIDTPENGGAREFRLESFKGFNSVFDRSIKGANPREFTTPPLDKSKIPVLKEFVDKLKLHNYDVNKSCGLHVHLDAPEFKIKQKSTNNQIVTLSQFVESHEIAKKIGKELRYSEITIYKRNLWDTEASNSLKNLARVNNRSGINRVQIGLRVRPPVDATDLSFYTKSLVWEDLNNVKNGNPFIKQRFKGVSDVYVLTVEVDSELDKFYSSKNKSGKKTPFDLDNNDIVEFRIADPEMEDIKVKNLLGFYTSISDVISAILPKTRRNNSYALPLNEIYTLEDIKKVKTITDFDNVWYSQKGKEKAFMKDVEFFGGKSSDKHSKYNWSKYLSINFHSLNRIGTVEIRSHSGTLNLRKILYWVCLHQTILDKVSKEKGDDVWNFIEYILSIQNIEAKAKELFNYLELDSEVAEYFYQRINKFKE